MSLNLADLAQSLSDSDATTATPNPALNDIAINCVLADIIHGLDQTVDPFWRRHSKRPHLPYNLQDIWLHIPRQRALVVAAVSEAGSLLWLVRSEEHTSELQSLMRISYAVFCLKKKKKNTQYYVRKT